MARYGNLGTQYLDDAGDPLISGKLYIYDSGSTTAKDTYADVNLSIINTNPVLLTASGRQPNIFFNGSARIILTKSDGTQIEVRDPVGGDSGSGQFETWNALTIYNEADITIASNDRYYKSFAAANQGNDPTTTPSKWEEVEFLYVWNTAVTYITNDTVKGSDGIFYRSLAGGNVGNDPVSDGGVNWGAPIPAEEYNLALTQATALSF